jgi:two-component system phosphate regulon sensor histidine kinase PhoR
VPLSEVAATLRETRRRLLYAAGMGILAALALGLLAARVAARPLRAMTRSATKLAQGEYDIRLPSPTPDEFGVLSQALESLGQQLKGRISDLTAERDLQSAILGSMIEGVLVVGADGRVVEANSSAPHILAVDGALVGRAIGDLPLHPRILAVLQDALRGRTVETEIDVSAGSQLAVNVRPLHARPGAIVAVLHDVTRLRRLETMRRDFVANVSHELRTPVAAIQGFAETLLAGKTDDPTRRQFLDVIHRHARRIGRLVEDLLTLADVEVKPPDKLVRESVKVGAVARRVRESVRERASQMEATIDVDVDDALLVVGDPDWIEQVLENLVDNAVKYGKKGGAIAVRGRRQGDRAVLEVLDDGPGIAAHHLGRIFERFYRIDAGRSRDLGGTGLGLAIVKHFVEAMGGQIGVESRPGDGTRFTVSLPTRG